MKRSAFFVLGVVTASLIFGSYSWAAGPAQQFRILKSDILSVPDSSEVESLDGGGALGDIFVKPGGISADCSESYFEETEQSTGAIIVTHFHNGGDREVLTSSEPGSVSTINAVNATGSIVGSVLGGAQKRPQAFRWSPGQTWIELLQDGRKQGLDVESTANVITDTKEAGGSGALFDDSQEVVRAAAAWYAPGVQPQLIVESSLKSVDAVSRGSSNLYFAGKFASNSNVFIKAVGAGGVTTSNTVPGGSGLEVTGLISGGATGIAYNPSTGRPYRVSPGGAVQISLPPAVAGVPVTSVETKNIFLRNGQLWFFADATLSNGSHRAYMNVGNIWYDLTPIMAGSSIPGDAVAERVAGFGSAVVSGTNAVCFVTTNRLGSGNTNAAIVYLF